MRRVLPLAVSLSGLLLLVGCADDGAVKVDPPTAGVGGSARPANSGGTFAKEGWFGSADGLHARIEIKGVERQGAKSVLRYSVTSLDSSTKSATFAIRLLDPVGRRLYRPTGSTSGDDIAPGTTREMMAEYPPLPADVQKVTALTPGTAGEFTGIPVTTGTTAPSQPTPSSAPSTPPPSVPPPSSSAPSGPSVRAEPLAGSRPLTAPTTMPFPTLSTTPTTGVTPSTPPGGNPVDLYDVVEGESMDVTSSASAVTVSLRSDVLFDGDSAELSSRAKAVLDEAAQQIKPKAMRSLTFEGHTDGSGGDSETMTLSQDRAKAVMEEIKSRLGDSFTYTASGKGEAEPVAENSPRNDRVEISYQAKTAARTTTSPAAFRPQDGKTVATRSARFGGDKRRLDVKPFYRDGAYIVAVFDIVNEGPGTTPADASYPHKDYPEGVFTSFSVQVPGHKDVYRAVRIGAWTPGASGAYVDPGRGTFRTGVNQPVRGFVYLPAPSGSITSVDFDGGPFGKVHKVPVS